MKFVRFKAISIIFLILIVSGFAIYFFCPKPPLLEGVSFSNAYRAEQGQLLRLTLSHDDQYRLFTPLQSIAPELIAATLLQEDQYFYKHPGINPFAMGRAFWQTYVWKSRRVGASTLTMQVARMRFKLNSKSLSGKLLQIGYALLLERHYSKQAILEAYFNLAPYGRNIQGVGAASEIYFHKPARQLTLPEALTLSIMVQNPKYRTPNNPKLNAIRNTLFERWLIIHPEDKRLRPIMSLPMHLYRLEDLPFIAPHLILWLQHRNPLAHSEVKTTLNFKFQLIIERVAKRYLERVRPLGVDNVAIQLVDTRDMGVKAALGSADFFSKPIQGQINGVEIKRSPGSTLKPFIYALAMDQGLIHPATVLKDVPKRFGSYSPDNFDYDFIGPIKAKEALILSRNIPAVDLANQLKQPDLHQLLADAHVSALKPPSQYGLALSLGGNEVTISELSSLYATLANQGVWRPLRYLESEKSELSQRLLSPEASFLVLDILKDTPRPGKKRVNELHPTFPVAWKTGTSSGYRDAWTVGVYGPYVLTVWLGHFNNKGHPALIGRSLAAPLFFEIVRALEQEVPSQEKLHLDPRGLNLKQIEVCKLSGMLPTKACKDRVFTWFIPGKSPIKTDTIHREVAIDERTGLRTCHFDEHTRFEVFEFWPSDVLRLFKHAGIQPRLPPAYEADCQPTNAKSVSPQITSLQSELSYMIRLYDAQSSRILLQASVDADVTWLYWFIDNQFIAKTKRGLPYWWSAKPGKYLVRVVDDHGLSDSREIHVAVAN